MTDRTAPPPAHDAGALPPWSPAARSWAQPPGRRILGLQPALLVAIVLLTLVSLLTIVLILVGDVETQAPRVAWTVVAFVGCTGLTALDLSMSRRSAVPLVIGVAANAYLLAVLMLATWVRPSDPLPGGEGWGPSHDRGLVPEPFGPPLAIVLLGLHLLAFLVVRAAAAGAWALVALGRRGATRLARIAGLVAASLLGVAGVMLTLHLAITPFGVVVGDAYWRIAVVAVVLAALAACITTLLRWSRRQLEVAARPEPPPVASAPPAGWGRTHADRPPQRRG